MVATGTPGVGAEVGASDGPGAEADGAGAEVEGAAGAGSAVKEGIPAIDAPSATLPSRGLEDGGP